MKLREPRIRTSAEPDELGWVIEHGASEPCKPRYWAGKSWDGLSQWTDDHMRAIRFVREIDARRVAEAADDGVPNNYRICEHAWSTFAEPKTLVELVEEAARQPVK